MFEGVVKPEELADIAADIEAIKDRLPASRDAMVDANANSADASVKVVMREMIMAHLRSRGDGVK